MSSLTASNFIAIEAVNATARIEKTIIFSNLSLKISAGRFTCVVGPNGAGKSTLLKVLAGLLPPLAGQVRWCGQPLTALPLRERALQTAWLGQGETSPDAWLVADLVMLGRLPHQGLSGQPSLDDRAAVIQALSDVEMSRLASRPMSQLSGGERQRVLLARMLATQAPMLLMDEPLSHLDAPHQADWLRIVQKQINRGHTVVAILHELSVALKADDLVVMKAGTLLHHGPSSDTSTRQALLEAFDGRIEFVGTSDKVAVLPL